MDEPIIYNTLSIHPHLCINCNNLIYSCTCCCTECNENVLECLCCTKCKNIIKKCSCCAKCNNTKDDCLCEIIQFQASLVSQSVKPNRIKRDATSNIKLDISL